jgi:hypothetical protein
MSSRFFNDRYNSSVANVKRYAEFVGSSELALVYEREKQRENRNRATLAVARKLVAYLIGRRPRRMVVRRAPVVWKYWRRYATSFSNRYSYAIRPVPAFSQHGRFPSASRRSSPRGCSTAWRSQFGHPNDNLSPRPLTAVQLTSGWPSKSPGDPKKRAHPLVL